MVHDRVLNQGGKREEQDKKETNESRNYLTVACGGSHVGNLGETWPVVSNRH